MHVSVSGYRAAFPKANPPGGFAGGFAGLIEKLTSLKVRPWKASSVKTTVRGSRESSLETKTRRGKRRFSRDLIRVTKNQGLNYFSALHP